MGHEITKQSKDRVLQISIKLAVIDSMSQQGQTAEKKSGGQPVKTSVGRNAATTLIYIASAEASVTSH